ncbi:MAG TPA: hypothetical protein VLQ80_04385 [Candidatus Saccharimonadia bacterium]|nr:hypothetical protein [Candidatus Saccharimonadia bacterium]
MVRRQRGFNIGQQPGRFSTGRLHSLAIERRQGRCHTRMPAGWIAGLSPLCQKNEVALGVHGHQTKAARKRFVLRDRLTLRHALGSQLTIVLEEVRTFEAIPAASFCCLFMR